MASRFSSGLTASAGFMTGAGSGQSPGMGSQWAALWASSPWGMVGYLQGGEEEGSGGLGKGRGGSGVCIWSGLGVRQHEVLSSSHVGGKQSAEAWSHKHRCLRAARVCYQLQSLTTGCRCCPHAPLRIQQLPVPAPLSLAALGAAAAGAHLFLRGLRGTCFACRGFCLSQHGQNDTRMRCMSWHHLSLQEPSSSSNLQQRPRTCHAAALAAVCEQQLLIGGATAVAAAVVGGEAADQRR